MMNQETQLKVQAFCDGELPEGEAREIANLVATNADAASLLKELQNTRKALSGFEASIELPETRDFFWSKIKREIDRSEISRPRPAPVSILATLRKILLPTASVAVVLIAGLLIINRSNFQPGSPEVVASATDADAFTYNDESAGMTLVWFSYPGENVAKTGASDTL